MCPWGLSGVWLLTKDGLPDVIVKTASCVCYPSSVMKEATKLKSYLLIKISMPIYPSISLPQTIKLAI